MPIMMGLDVGEEPSVCRCLSDLFPREQCDIVLPLCVCAPLLFSHVREGGGGEST